MPYSTERKNTTFYADYTGTVTGDEIHASQSWFGEKIFDKIRFVLADFTQTESLDLTTQQVKEIAYLNAAAAKSNPNIKLALVASRDDIKESVKTYAEFFDDSLWKIAIFDTTEQAQKWLDE